jgi:hypothetical protein
MRAPTGALIKQHRLFGQAKVHETSSVSTTDRARNVDEQSDRIDGWHRACLKSLADEEPLHWLETDKRWRSGLGLEPDDLRE